MTSAVDALVREKPALAAAIAPDDPRIVFRLARAQVILNRGVVTPQSAAAVREAMAGAPLAEEPFLVEGLAAQVAGDAARSERLLSTVKRRNPRARAARLLLLNHYLQAGRVPDAAAEIAVLHRLMPAASKVLVPELAKFARNPATRASLAGILRSDPELGEAVLQDLAAKNPDPELVMSLARQVPAPAGAERPWQGKLIRAVVEKGNVEQAQRLWQQLSGRSQPAEGTVYDPAFQGLPGPPPFNWELSSSGAGVAERSKSGGLQVEYYGRQPVELAAQLLRLAPGRHVLRATVEGDSSEKGPQLAWRLSCLDGTTIAELPLRDVTFQPKALSAGFSVPPGCGAQWLRLNGIPSEFPDTQSVTVRNVSIEAAGRP